MTKAARNRPFDLVWNITAYEDGRLDDVETVNLFQYLIDTGLAWSLQGSYGRDDEMLGDFSKCQEKFALFGGTGLAHWISSI